MYDTILVPTDGSDHAVRAAEHAAYLARLFDARVHVLHVVDVQSAAGMFDAGGVDDAFVARLEAAGERAIDAVEAAIERVGARTATESLRTALVRGTPGEAIREYARDNGVDLIAMGTHGRRGVNRYVRGSVAERVVRRADVPVLTARATEVNSAAEGYDEVLVPTDGSAVAAAAVDHGLAVARAADARIHVIGVVDFGEIAAGPAYAPPADVAERLETEAEAATASVATRAWDADLDVVTAVREGIPADELVRYADETDVDLIAMGTAGRTGVRRYLRGSTTERIVRRAAMPVFTVNASDGTAAESRSNGS